MKIRNWVWALAVLPFAAWADAPLPMQAMPGFDVGLLIGDWFEVASTPTILEQDCHGTTASVAAREDTRLTLKIMCRKGSVTGAGLPIEGVMVQTDPGVFQVRLVHLLELGNLDLMVLWQAPDGSMTVIGSPVGAVGWVWSKTPHPDAAALEAAKQVLVKYGYGAQFIANVDQGE